MRKILLATTALVGVALSGVGIANAAAPSSPITVTVGGYDDFVAGVYREAPGAIGVPTYSAAGVKQSSHDFENEFKLSIDAVGKAANGVEYGANISLWNGSEVGNAWTGGGSSLELASAYVWLSGAFGKVLFGDEHGASDLFVYAPTVGEGQVDGRYTDFTSPYKLARFQPSGVDNTEHSTKITYYTPKVGNETNKVQLGVSYIPNLYDYGQNVIGSTATNSTHTYVGGQDFSPYQDVLKGAVQYAGSFHPVNVTASAQLISGEASGAVAQNTLLFSNAPLGEAENFVAWGAGAQAAYEGFTAGGSYVNLGRYDTVQGQNKNQEVTTLGGKYEFNKVSVGLNWLNGAGYNNMLNATTNTAKTQANDYSSNYVDSFNAYGVGATYTWFPGLTSAIDGVLFSQSVRDQADRNDGYVVVVSQKLAF